MASAVHRALLQSCTDDNASSPHSIDCTTLGRTTSGFGSAGSNRFSHGMVLCPGLRALQAASCSTLASPDAVAAIVEDITREPLCCKVGWAGLEQGSQELALLLVKLGSTVSMPPRGEALRFVATHSGNAWLALVVATYLQRLHGGKLHGLLVAEGKSEWMHAGDVRTLIRQVGLSYRAKDKFEPLPELALLTADPRPNRLIGGVPWTAARAILPRTYVVNTTPFAACLRVGKFVNVDALLGDFGLLAPYCRTFAFWSGPLGGGKHSAAKGEESAPAVSVSDTLSDGVLDSQFAARLGTWRTPGYVRVRQNGGDTAQAINDGSAHDKVQEQMRPHRAGNWTVVSITPPGRLWFANCLVIGRDCEQPDLSDECVRHGRCGLW